jgi:hypothetical protein
MKRWLFFIVLVLNLVVTTNPAYSMSGNVHVADMNEVFENLSSSNTGVKDLYKNLTSNIIDDSTKDRFLKSLPVAPDGLKLDHRSLFHWGFSGDIPFNTEGNLKRYLEKFPPGERDRIKKLIALEWQARVNHITDEAVKILGWPRGSERKAKAFLGVLYDAHLLGDLMPGNKLIESVQNVDRIKEDLLKNFRRLFGKNSKLVDVLEKKLTAIISDHTLNQQQKAEKILQALKETPIGQAFADIDKLIKNNQWSVSKENSKYFKLAGSMAARYHNLVKNLSPAAQNAIKTGIVTGIISGVGHSWSVLNGEEGLEEAVQEVLKDSSLAGASIYISEGVIQNLGGGKYAITALIENSAKTTLSNQAIGTFLNYGVATFIFDEVHNVYHYAQGKITREQFIAETAKSAVKGTVAGGLSYATVMICKTSAGNPVVIAVSIAGYYIATKAIAAYEKLNKRNYFFAEDVLGKLPLNMQNRITAFNLEEWSLTPSAFDESAGTTPSAFDENLGTTPSAFDL